MLTIATSSVVSFFSVWTANCRAGPVPSWFCITFSIPKPVESNIPINSSDFPSQAKPTDSPNSPVESTQIPGWCALGRPLSMWIGKMLMCLGVLVKKTRWENFPQGLESKKWGETSPWKRRWNTKLGINYKQWFWVSILSIFFVNIFKVTQIGCFGFSHDVVSLTVGNSTVLRQGKPGMKNEAFRWNRLWCLESNIQVDSKESDFC